jgi:phosphoribosylformylglycinamidine cyclo-ligase
LTVVIEEGRWPIPPIFRLIQERCGVDEHEIFRTLNMGIGMVLVVGPKDVEKTIALFAKMRQKAYVIGDLVSGPHGVSIY